MGLKAGLMKGGGGTPGGKEGGGMPMGPGKTGGCRGPIPTMGCCTGGTCQHLQEFTSNQDVV